MDNFFSEAKITVWKYTTMLEDGLAVYQFGENINLDSIKIHIHYRSKKKNKAMKKMK